MYYGLKFKNIEPNTVSISESTFGVASLVYDEYMNRKTLMETVVDENLRIKLEAQLEILEEISIKDVWEKIKKKIKEFFAMVKRFISVVIDKIKKFFNKLIEKIKKTFSRVNIITKDLEKNGYFSPLSEYLLKKEYNLYEKPPVFFNTVRDRPDLSKYLLFAADADKVKSIEDDRDKYLKKFKSRVESVKNPKKSDKYKINYLKDILFFTKDSIYSSLFFNENDIKDIERSMDTYASAEKDYKDVFKTDPHTNELEILSKDINFLQTCHNLHIELLDAIVSFNNNNKIVLARFLADFEEIILSRIEKDRERTPYVAQNREDSFYDLKAFVDDRYDEDAEFREIKDEFKAPAVAY